MLFHNTGHDEAPFNWLATLEEAPNKALALAPGLPLCPWKPAIDPCWAPITQETFPAALLLFHSQGHLSWDFFLWLLLLLYIIWR